MCFSYKTTLEVVGSCSTKTFILTWSIQNFKINMKRLKGIILLQPKRCSTNNKKIFSFFLKASFILPHALTEPHVLTRSPGKYSI